MKKLKEIINLILKNKLIKHILNKLKFILGYLLMKTKSNSIVNKLFLITKNFIIQHKVVTSVVIVSIVIAPRFFHSNSEFPYECYGQEIIVETDFESPTRHYLGADALAKLVSEEDKSLSLAKRVKIFRFEYDYKILAELYQSKYERIEKESGSKAAELFRRTVINDCN